MERRLQILRDSWDIICINQQNWASQLKANLFKVLKNSVQKTPFLSVGLGHCQIYVWPKIVDNNIVLLQILIYHNEIMVYNLWIKKIIYIATYEQDSTRDNCVIILNIWSTEFLWPTTMIWMTFYDYSLKLYPYLKLVIWLVISKSVGTLIPFDSTI